MEHLDLDEIRLSDFTVYDAIKEQQILINTLRGMAQFDSKNSRNVQHRDSP